MSSHCFWFCLLHCLSIDYSFLAFLTRLKTLMTIKYYKNEKNQLKKKVLTIQRNMKIYFQVFALYTHIIRH